MYEELYTIKRCGFGAFMCGFLFARFVKQICLGMLFLFTIYKSGYICYNIYNIITRAVMKQVIFVVEDDAGIMGLYAMALEDAGFEFCGFNSAEEMFSKLGEGKHCDLIILDIMLPGMSGLQALNRLKRDDRYASIPVIIASAKDDEKNKIGGLDAGADDYVAKPFSMNELVARIRANLRKAPVAAERDGDLLAYGDIEINDREHEVKVKGSLVQLTLKEYNLLHLLMENMDTVVKRDRILSVVWDYDYVGETRTLDMHIKSLRSKLGEKTDKQYIVTVRGVGYKFCKI